MGKGSARYYRQHDECPFKEVWKEIGPDPSSISSAMMGGIISNNASGMCCGVVHNAYHTLQYIRFILPDGRSYDTECLEDYGRLKIDKPELSDCITSLRNKILDNTALQQRIREKYLIKNTVGYSLNAFIDYEHPLNILAHALVGAEGTLGFISTAVLRTIPDHPCKATAMLYFTDIYAACDAIGFEKATGAEAVELMDRAALRSIETLHGVPAIVHTLPSQSAALLVEYQASCWQQVHDAIGHFTHQVSSDCSFTPKKGKKIRCILSVKTMK